MLTQKFFLNISIIVLVSLCMPGVVFSQWSQQIVTTGLDWVQEAVVAEGRNDNTARLYLASPGSRAIYECSWNGTTWDRVMIDTSAFQMRDICAGRGHNDNVIRIYSTDEGTVLLEHSWTGSTWQSDTVGLANSLGVTIGAGRNDDTIRVYASKPSGSADNCIYEYTWNGSGWSVDSMQGGSDWYYKPALGIGRNDDTIRIYGLNWDQHMYEYTWNGSGWDVFDVDDSLSGNDIDIGVGRNDGVNRLYCGEGYGHLREYTWNGSNWIQTSDLQPTSSTYMREVHIGDGRNDGANNVYCAGQNGGVFEYSWSGSDWQVDSLGAEIDGLTIGEGRNDGIMRVYAASLSAVVEYTYATGIFENRYSSDNNFRLCTHPNPFSDEITIQLGENTERESTNDGVLKIYDASGRMVRNLWTGKYLSMPAFITWDGTDDNNRKLSDGIYFLRYNTQEFQVTQKILMIK